jgi:dTDP-4-amino-4,6-dideoxygalactose transaminase
MDATPKTAAPRRKTFLSFQPPSLGEEEIQAVAEVLRSGQLSTGPRAAELERRFAAYTGAKHALAVSSGTAALHLSLVAGGIGPGDEVIVPPITWPATANVVVHAGARPVFCEVRAGDLTLDSDRIAEVASERTRAIMPVDLAGAACELGPILDLARDGGWLVVEDAAHAVESAYRGRKVGTISDTTCFSLYATKNVAAGEGGMLTTDCDELAEAVEELRLLRRGHASRYDIQKAGFKANLADVNAAIALCQLDRIDAHREIRLRHVAMYDAAIEELSGIEPLARPSRPGDVHAHHLYIVRIDPDLAGGTRDEYQEALLAENIGTSIHFLPVHRLTYYRERFPDQPRLPIAEQAGAEILSLPLSPAHSDEDIEDAIAALRRVHAALTGR